MSADLMQGLPRPALSTFPPNTYVRAAAEALVGMAGLNVVTDWAFDFAEASGDGPFFLVLVPGWDEPVRMRPMEVRWFARGVLVTLNRYAPGAARVSRLLPEVDGDATH